MNSTPSFDYSKPNRSNFPLESQTGGQEMSHRLLISQNPHPNILNVVSNQSALIDQNHKKEILRDLAFLSTVGKTVIEVRDSHNDGVKRVRRKNESSMIVTSRLTRMPSLFSKPDKSV